MRLLLRNDCDSSVWVDVSPNDTLADLRSSLPSDAQDAARLPCTTGSRAAFVMRTGRRVPLYEFPELSSEIQDGGECLENGWKIIAENVGRVAGYNDSTKIIRVGYFSQRCAQNKGMRILKACGI